MSMFNPYWKCNYDQLITYYPRYYREVFEMDAILRAEGGLADGIQSGIDKMLMNNFIDSADEETLTQLEKFLYMQTDKTKSIDSRRKSVLSFFIGFGKLSAEKIKAILKVFTKSDVEMEFKKVDEKGNNYLYITCERGTENEIDTEEMIDILSRKIPAHIIFNLIIKYTFTGTANNKSYGGISKVKSVVFDDGWR